jgi:hypothetical protein
LLLQRGHRERRILRRGCDQHGLLLSSNHLDKGVFVQVLAYMAAAHQYVGYVVGVEDHHAGTNDRLISRS